MKNKTNSFVCILLLLSINLQYDIAAYALDENNTEITEQQDLNLPETEILKEESKESANAEIINGAEDLSVDAFTADETQ